MNAADNQSHHDEMSDAEARQQARKHVFCVNGASDFLNLVRDLLRRENYNVTTTNFVPNTYDQIAALQPDLIIVDLVVGKRSGWDLLEKLTREASTDGIPLLITSTDPRLLEEAQADPERFNSRNVLAKPFRANELLADVDRLIGEA